MLSFSKKILNFLANHAKSMRYDLTRLPSSGSSLKIGDIIFFKYHRPGNHEITMALVVKPVIKEARTGNELVSAVKIPMASFFSQKVIDNLYSNRRTALPEDNYRTYILGRMEHIRRVEKSEEQRLQDEVSNMFDDSMRGGGIDE